jgi:hypothetical protein
MPSVSLRIWASARAAALDEIEGAHRAVGGTGPGRRYATQQINQAYALLLSAQFQGFCRDLHSECAEHLAQAMPTQGLQDILRQEFGLHRRLDGGNPNPGNLGADFNRLGIRFWDEVARHDARTPVRVRLLEELNAWRNAIAHQDLDPARLGGRILLRLRRVRAWRAACHGLAQSFDQMLGAYLLTVTGTSPW